MAITGIGQRTTKNFKLVNSGTVTTLPGFCEDGKFDCGFVMPAFADGSTDDLKNDKYSLLVLGQDWVTAIEFVIQKNISSVWVDQDTIINNTYGEYYEMGYYTNNEKYSGVVLYWKEILSAFGVGEYRLKVTQTTPLGDNISYSKPTCLKEYSCDVQNSVRIEWYMNKGIGDPFNDREILDYSDTNWYYQVRIPKSFFGYPKSSYESEQIQYTNGMIEDIVSKEDEKYVLKLGSIPAWLHRTIKSMAFQADNLYITDYSPNNPEEFIQKAVKKASSYEPRYTTGSKCAPVTVELKPAFNRLEKFRCP